jgi:hypothetical protein
MEMASFSVEYKQNRQTVYFYDKRNFLYVNRIFALDFLLLSIILVSAVETRIPVTLDIALPEMWLFRKEIRV